MIRKLLILTFLISISVSAQYNYRDSNRIGLFFGLNQYTLNTNDFQTQSGQGWNTGLSIRGNFYNDWDMVYSFQFSQNSFSVATKKLIIPEQVEFVASSVQLSLLGSYKIIPNHFSVEFGPIIQFSGRLETDRDTENNTIIGTNLLAKDIVNITKFNFYPTVGVTLGVRHVRVFCSYQYGLINTLTDIKYNNSAVKYKGNSSMLNANLIVYL